MDNNNIIIKPDPDTNNNQHFPMKRRRVTRACDECRKKKVKCDGQQPCIHCTVYSYECTYNQPSIRKNNNDVSKAKRPTYKRSTTMRLQDQINKYKWLFNEVFPKLPDIDNLDIPTFLQIYHNFTLHSNSNLIPNIMQEYKIISENHQSSLSNSSFMSNKFNTNSSLNLNQQHIVNNFENSSNVSSAPSSSCASPEPTPNNTTSNNTNNTTSYYQLGREIKILLPPKPIALQFLKVAWEECCVLFRFYHRPSFIKQFDDLYETDPEQYTQTQMQFLPLCYSTMAVGALFSKSIRNNSNRNNFLQDEGYKYFVAARKLIDITNARDLNSIQTILMLFIFLQCSARLSTCYSYIGVALRSALREGFHRVININDTNNKKNLLEIEMRKRLFFTIYKLDIYVNAMMGLPRSISPNDFDQILPFDLSDDNISKDKLFFENQKGILSSAGVANQHTKLMMIFDSIITELYPIKKFPNTIVSHETINKFEVILKNWSDNLPNELKFDLQKIPSNYERANNLLHLSFFHVQIILYRPFIHILSTNIQKTTNIDSFSLQRANNSISVSRDALKLAKKMLVKNFLTGSYWYGIYTIFFAVASLLYYIHEVKPTNDIELKKYQEIIKEAEEGRKIVLHLRESSVAANRTYNLLDKLFEKLNLKTIRLSAIQCKLNNKIPQDNENTSYQNTMKIGANNSNLNVNIKSENEHFNINSNDGLSMQNLNINSNTNTTANTPSFQSNISESVDSETFNNILTGYNIGEYINSSALTSNSPQMIPPLATPSLSSSTIPNSNSNTNTNPGSYFPNFDNNSIQPKFENSYTDLATNFKVSEQDLLQQQISRSNSSAAINSQNFNNNNFNDLPTKNNNINNNNININPNVNMNQQIPMDNNNMNNMNTSNPENFMDNTQILNDFLQKYLPNLNETFSDNNNNNPN